MFVYQIRRQVNYVLKSRADRYASQLMEAINAKAAAQVMDRLYPGVQIASCVVQPTVRVEATPRPTTEELMKKWGYWQEPITQFQAYNHVIQSMFDPDVDNYKETL